MTRNLGGADRIIRAFVGLFLVIAPLANTPPIWASSTLAGASMIVGVVLLLTTYFQFCPLYRLLGVSTCKT